MSRLLLIVRRGYGAVACTIALSSLATFADDAPRWQQAAERMPTIVAGAPAGDIPAGQQPFAVPDGFAVERLFVVPREELGSWVCLATDPEGRILASDQGGQGLVRISPAPLDGSGDTIVEKIPVPLTGCRACSGPSIRSMWSATAGPAAASIG